MKNLILISLALALPACSNMIPNQGSIPCLGAPAVGRGVDRLVAVGDSNTAGQVSCNQGHLYSWATQVSVDKNLTLVNLSVGGTEFANDNTHGAAEYRSIESIALLPTDTVVMWLGFNDIRFHGDDPGNIVVFKARLTEVLTQIAPNVFKIIIGTPIHPEIYESLASPQAVDDYAAAILSVVNSLSFTNIIVITPDSDIMRAPEYFMSIDGFHLDSIGQLLIAQAFQGVM